MFLYVHLPPFFSLGEVLVGILSIFLIKLFQFLIFSVLNFFKKILVFWPFWLGLDLTSASVLREHSRALEVIWGT